MAEIRTGRGSDQFPLRLPDGMREKISANAKANGRSMNSEIVARLESSFSENESMWDILNRFEDLEPELQSRISELEEKMNVLWNRPNPNEDPHPDY